MDKPTCITDGCDSPTTAKGWCKRCYLGNYYRTHDGAKVGKKNVPKGRGLAWLKSVVDLTGDECRLWPFRLRSNGYAYTQWEGRCRAVHHVVLILDGREPPVHPLVTRHLCNNKACCNPRHIVVGTPKENRIDMEEAGVAPVKERHGMAKLTFAQVLEIRTSGVSTAVLAHRFHVNRATINDIKARRTWR